MSKKFMHAASIKFALIPPRCSEKISFFPTSSENISVIWTLSQFTEFSERHLGKIQVDQFEKHRLYHILKQRLTACREQLTKS